MSVATQTFGRPLTLNIRHGGSFASIGARLWLRVIESIKARRALAAERRAEQELLALAAEYAVTMPSFAADLRAANARRA